MAKPCNCSDVLGHARAVESAVFQSLCNAMNNPQHEARWLAHADLLDHKFITAHGRHYAAILTREATK